MKTAWIHKRVAALLVAICAMVEVPPTAAEIRWETDLARATAAATQANRPMLLEFWARWCAPCAVMDNEVFSDRRIIAAMDGVLPVRVDMDRHDATARKYEVEATPTLVFTDSHGNELFRHTGLLMADRLLPLLQALPRDVTRINQLAGAIARNKNDFSSLVALGEELRSAGLYRASNQAYGRALRTRFAGQEADARARILIDTGRNHAELQDTREAERTFERFLREFGGHPAEPEVLLALAEVLLARNRPAEARARLQTLISRHAGTPAAAEAARLMNRMPGG